MTVLIPTDWTTEEHANGLLIVREPGTQLALHLQPQSRSPASLALAALHHPDPSPHPRPVTSGHAEAELRRFVAPYRQVRFHERSHILSGTHHLTCCVNGVEVIRTGVSILQRILRQGPVVHWRFWVVLSPHMTAVAFVNGREDAIQTHAATLQRIVGSVHLPNRDLLVGRSFTEAVASLARSYYPRTAVAMLDDSHLKFGACQVELVHLHRRYLASPDKLPTHVRAFFSELQRLNDPAAVACEWSQARESIMPVLVETAQLPRFGPHSARQEWVNDLHIVYVADDDGACRTVTPEQLTLWGIDLDSLHEQSLENMVRRSSELTMEGSRAEGYTMLALSTADPYNASRILLPDLYRKLREHLGRTFYVAIPSRELLLAFCTTRPEVLQRIRRQIATDYQRMDNPVSQKLFLVTPDGICGDPDEAEDFGR